MHDLMPPPTATSGVELRETVRGGGILTLEACASLMGCCTEHLMRLCRRGEIPAAKVGKSWVFVEQDVVAWIRERYARPAKRTGRPRRLPQFVS